MWKPSQTVYKHMRYIDKSLLIQLPSCSTNQQIRKYNDGLIQSRYQKSKTGWFSRRGTRPGYPASWPDSRVVGVDLNLQVTSCSYQDLVAVQFYSPALNSPLIRASFYA